MPTRSAATRSALERGRESFDRRAWADAHDQLAAADLEQPLEPQDLERLAIASYLIGSFGRSQAVSVRAFQESIRVGDIGRAARSAFWIAMQQLSNGELAPAAGWLARADRLVSEDGVERVESGYLLVAAAVRSLGEGDAEKALSLADQAAEVGRRYSDPDLVVLARLGAGEALVGLDQATRGVALFDEVMVSVTSGEVSPVMVGIVYCAVLTACQQIFELRRAQEWTAVFDRWCASQPQLVQFQGQCRLYRAELLQFHGAWRDADVEARQASERLAKPESDPALGDAIYRIAELHRLRGEYDEADDGYRRASQLGRPPEPGLALLRLAQGRTEFAVAAIRRATDEATATLAKPRLLEPCVEIMLAAGSVAAARVAADELSRIARHNRTPLLQAMAARAEGAVLLGERDAKRALPMLRTAWNAWRSLGAPYEAARARVLIGLACRAVGDVGSAAMELDAAREAFRGLGAVPDVERVEALAYQTAAGAVAGLTPREVEVLRLVATGKSNRSIAADLVISEKTVARHVSNIFDKLSVSSRAAATAYAYEHDLVAVSG